MRVALYLHFPYLRFPVLAFSAPPSDPPAQCRSVSMPLVRSVRLPFDQKDKLRLKSYVLLSIYT